jgi:DNA-3-methyladenine glycosylase II
LNPEEYARATRVIARRDPVIRELVRRYGVCGMAAAQKADHFTALVQAITSQQLSTKAARTIFGRVAALHDGAGVTPHGFTAISDEALRAAGLSRQKIAYVRDLTAKVIDGTLPLDSLDTLEDERVIEAITEVKGFGRWSAEMFLMFRLHRPDVMPVDDLGIVKAMQKQYRMRKRPNADRMRKIAEAWRPYRSVACWYLWRSLEKD